MNAKKKHQAKALFDHTLALARTILPFMGEKGIPATPENYTIFFYYFEGSYSLIQEVVKEQLQSGQPWTEETTRRIFDQVFSHESNLIWHKHNEKLAERLKQMTENIIAETSASAEAAEKTSQKLSASLKEARNLEPDSIPGWLGSALEEVGQIELLSRNLGRNLKKRGEGLLEIMATLETVKNLALTDELTKMPNRRAWDNRLAEEFSRFKRYHRPCGLLLIDLDDFKKINDTYGHLIGDKALQEVAKLIKGGLRNNDFAARYGGEEFTVLLPETDLVASAIVAERLRRDLDQTCFTVRGLPTDITASFGVSQFHHDDEEPEEAFERADQALYLAKSRGKNRVCREDEVSSSACQTAT